MRICDYCNKEIDEGYLADDYYIMCEKCKKELYKEEEFNKNIMKEKYFGLHFMMKSKGEIL